MKTYRYKDWTIEPKRDFGNYPQKGWLAIHDKEGNCMPGGTWFKSVREAKRFIDVYIRVKGNAQRFWEIAQPFEYARGQRVNFQEGEIRQGRFRATINNFVVVRVERNLHPSGL